MKDKQIVVNPSPVPTQVTTLTRDIVLVLAALPALIAVLGTKDVKQISTYLASTEFAPVLGILVTLGVIIWRQVIARNATEKLVVVARAAPEEVAIVKGETLPDDAAELATVLKEERE